MAAAITQTCVVHLLRNCFRYASQAVLGGDRQGAQAGLHRADASRPPWSVPEFTEPGAALSGDHQVVGERLGGVCALPEFDIEIRTVICTTNAIVIWSSFGVSLMSDTGRRGRRVLRGGRGYLQPSRRQSLRRDDARCTGGLTGLAA